MIRVLRLSSPPSLGGELEQTRDFARVDGMHEDHLIAEMIDGVAVEFERATETALLFQQIRVILDGWPAKTETVGLPIGPVMAEPLFEATADGTPFDAELIPGMRPLLRLYGPPGTDLLHAAIQIDYQAGFGASSGAIPADIMVAIRDQVTALYDERGSTSHTARGQARGGLDVMSYAMQRAIGRYRGVRA